MQITLVQAEIEDAIKNYVTGQIAIKPGQEIEIDLKATRGAEGYQAIINIGAAVRTPTPAATPAPVAATAETKPVVTTADLKRMQAEEAAAEEAAEAAGTGGEPVEEAATAEEKPADVPATPAKRRLFGGAGLTKPSNT